MFEEKLEKEATRIAEELAASMLRSMYPRSDIVQIVKLAFLAGATYSQILKNFEDMKQNKLEFKNE